MDKHEMVNAIAAMTQLDPSTINDLLECGWVYHERNDGPQLWIAPGRETKFNTAEENRGN